MLVWKRDKKREGCPVCLLEVRAERALYPLLVVKWGEVDWIAIDKRAYQVPPHILAKVALRFSDICPDYDS